MARFDDFDHDLRIGRAKTKTAEVAALMAATVALVDRYRVDLVAADGLVGDDLGAATKAAEFALGFLADVADELRERVLLLGR